MADFPHIANFLDRDFLEIDLNDPLDVEFIFQEIQDQAALENGFSPQKKKNFFEEQMRLGTPLGMEFSTLALACLDNIQKNQTDKIEALTKEAEKKAKEEAMMPSRMEEKTFRSAPPQTRTLQ